jgi:methylmalonyl-CoA mutase
MINQVVAACDFDVTAVKGVDVQGVLAGDRSAISRSHLGRRARPPHRRRPGRVHHCSAATALHPVLGITGTGGSGKSSLTDELVRRFRVDQQDKLRIAVVAVDPTRRKGGGALLGDRIRMNSLDGDRVYFRSLATRGGREVPDELAQVVTILKAAAYDLVIIETPGIGQGDGAITNFADVALYVMTPEYGAASQLEKIDMLDFADVVAINKFERRGAMDALRDVGRQLVRNHNAFGKKPEDMPVFGTSAATFNDDGVTALYQELRTLLSDKGLGLSEGVLPAVDVRHSSVLRQVVPSSRVRYLSEITETIRGYHAKTEEYAAHARRAQHLTTAREALGEHGSDELDRLITTAEEDLPKDVRGLLSQWPSVVEQYSGDEHVVKIRDKELHTKLVKESLSGNPIRRVALPRMHDQGDLLTFLRRENLPGYFPFTAGVFPFKRDNEDPARMFAGEGDPFRTNRRFKLVSEGQPATRLSTAFDSVTLYGRDPDPRPDIYGKVGTSGVSVATLDDMKALYDGFDLVAPTTSVSMTINGPAPTILAFFLNTVIDQQVEASASPGGPGAERCRARGAHGIRPAERAGHGPGRHPQGGPGPEHLPVLDRVLAADDGRHPGVVHREGRPQLLLGVDLGLSHRRGRGEPDQPARVHARQRFHLRGVVSGTRHGHRRLRAEPVVLLLQRHGPGVLRHRSRRPPHLGDRDEGEVRRQRAVAEAEVPRADERSLAARAGDGLQRHPHHAAGALAIYDNANSLHTNAFDEAVTTPSAESVRRALAIQLIINREWGLAMNENPLQGSFIIDELTDLVEAAVLAEFDRINERGGVLGAMETGYQRGRIQDESMLYEHRKHDGSLPIIGVNTFRNPAADDGTPQHVELARASEAEKESQLSRVRAYRDGHRVEAEEALARLKEAAVNGENVFAVLMDAARVCSLQQVTDAFFEVGGQYRRNV